MSERHEPRGRRVLWGGALAVALCAVAIAAPDAWTAAISKLFDARPAGPTAFGSDIAALDVALTEGLLSRPLTDDEIALIAARRLTRAGPMTPEEVAEAADTCRALPDDPQLAARLSARFGRLDAARVAAELEQLRAELRAAAPPGGSPAGGCGSCHAQTVPLPDGRAFDVAGIYPFALDEPAFEGGRRAPMLAEALETDTPCASCHPAHGSRGFSIDRRDRVDNMGLWVTVEPSDPRVLHVRVKVQNARSGHRAPAGPGASAYVVTAEARQHREPLALRFGTRLPAHLRKRGRDAGVVFARDYRDARGEPTSAADQIADLLDDTRLESGRFQQSEFLFDRVDDSIAHIEVVLWYLPDVTTWDDAQGIRRAFKPEK